MGLEVAYGGGLIRVHEPAVAGDVGGKNGGEPTPQRGRFVHDAVSRSHWRAGASVAHRPADREHSARR
jgi:hypothetical protein